MLCCEQNLKKNTNQVKLKLKNQDINTQKF